MPISVKSVLFMLKIVNRLTLVNIYSYSLNCLINSWRFSAKFAKVCAEEPISTAKPFPCSPALAASIEH